MPEHTSKRRGVWIWNRYTCFSFGECTLQRLRSLGVEVRIFGFLFLLVLHVSQAAVPAYSIYQVDSVSFACHKNQRRMDEYRGRAAGRGTYFCREGGVRNLGRREREGVFSGRLALHECACNVPVSGRKGRVLQTSLDMCFKST